MRLPSRHLATLLLPSLALFAAGCGTEIGRISYNGPGEGKTTVHMGGDGEVALWSEESVAAYRAGSSYSFAVEFWKGGARVATASCESSVLAAPHGEDPSRGGSGSGRCKKLKLPTTGDIEVRARFTASGAKGFALRSAALVVKQ
jgi:hypothetical protein